ncbi:NifU-like protein 2 [Carex littledalei]|uniref:NifU-like protein 2 n=1 Tax=Carex littledalei TaxID=544730 RepID=A0A833QMU4_9POAL|nr:NifU-like protein 2 [Carex littledalei]
MEHLKKVAKKTRKDLDITIGTYVPLFAKYLEVNILEEEVRGDPYINLTYLVEQRQLMTAWSKSRSKPYKVHSQALALPKVVYAVNASIQETTERPAHEVSAEPAIRATSPIPHAAILTLYKDRQSSQDEETFTASHLILLIVLVSPATKAVESPDRVVELPLTAENVKSVLDEVRPYLMADGGNVGLHEVDNNIVRLKLQGAL